MAMKGGLMRAEVMEFLTSFVELEFSIAGTSIPDQLIPNAKELEHFPNLDITSLDGRFYLTWKENPNK